MTAGWFAGAKGSCAAGSYSVMRGYWGDDERTVETIDKAGWLLTAVISGHG